MRSLDERDVGWGKLFRVADDTRRRGLGALGRANQGVHGTYVGRA